MREKMPPKKKQRCSGIRGQLWSQTEMLFHGLYTSGRSWRIEAYNSCNDSKKMQDFIKHVEHVLWKTLANNLTTFKSRA